VSLHRNNNALDGPEGRCTAMLRAQSSSSDGTTAPPPVAEEGRDAGRDLWLPEDIFSFALHAEAMALFIGGRESAKKIARWTFF
jgi:hypothetical protein